MVDGVWAAATAGIVAGLGVAMPLGPIAALLLREGLVNGFRVASAAAAGVATVDLVYCALATATGALLAQRVEEYRGIFLILSGLVVVLIGGWQLRAGLRQRHDAVADVKRASALAAYTRFIGLTAINPLTLVYFVALGGVVANPGGSWVVPLVFVVAVGSSSLAWQLALAAMGSLFGGAVRARTTRIIGVAASVLIMALGAAVIVRGVLAISV